MTPAQLLRNFRARLYTDVSKLDFALSDIVAAEKLAIHPNDRFDFIRLRGWFHYLRQEFRPALAAQMDAFARRPDLEGIKNIGILARRIKDREHAIEFLLRHESTYSHEFEFYDVLAHNCGEFGDPTGVKKFGSRSLELKDERHGQQAVRPDLPSIPPFAPTAERNIIAFSLFGASPRYVRPLMISADLRSHLYPLWTIRIYVDKTVPGEIVKTFQAKGCQVVDMTNAGILGTFWRFLVADDAAIDRFIIRDADSILNIRERVAVDAWVASNRHFHIMRDFYSHTELILAGLWGGVHGALPPVQKLIKAWLSRRNVTIYNQTTIDQIFLREEIWKIARLSALIHDSVFSFGDAVNFPAVGTLPPWKHVGQNDFIFFQGKSKGSPA